MFAPLALALGQLGDPVMLGVLVRCLLWSAASFAALHVVTLWLLHRLLDLHGWLGWAADVIGTVGASLLAMWLFLPVAVVIGTLYFDRIAGAVERRHYPSLPPPRGAPIAVQVWDAISIGLRILFLNVLALFAALLLPGIGLVLAWLIGGYAIGRGLFGAVAMRRLPRPLAQTLYRNVRFTVLVQGCVLALVGS